jgi:hypothetical protein
MISYVASFLSIPSWWMPDSWANAFEPTTALLGGTTKPVTVLTRRLTRVSCVASMPVRSPNLACRVASAITISSSDVFPARSPMPLMVTSAWRAPARMPASEFAVARPRSSWQCTEMTTSFAPGTFSRMPRMSAPNSSGVV